MKFQPRSIKPLPLTAALAMLLVGSSSLFMVGRVSAVPFTSAFVRLDTLKATTATGGRVCAKPSTTNLANVEASVQVTFPTTSATSYVVNATAANWTVNTTGLDSGQTAWPGITTATAVSGNTVTFPSSDLTSATTLYCFNFSGTNTLTTSSAGASETTQGTILTRTSAPANIDQTTYSESIITNDQVVINAVVPPSFAFVLSGNTDTFASNLSTATVNASNGARYAQVTTNAATGWVMWVKDLNNDAGHGALQSATAGNYQVDGTTAPGSAAHALVAGTEDYGLAATINTDAAGGGTVSLDPAYNGTTSNYAGTLDPTQFRPVASSNGTANGDKINLKILTTIAGQTPAASDYTDTMNVIGAGQF